MDKSLPEKTLSDLIWMGMLRNEEIADEDFFEKKLPLKLNFLPFVTILYM